MSVFSNLIHRFYKGDLTDLAVTTLTRYLGASAAPVVDAAKVIIASLSDGDFDGEEKRRVVQAVVRGAITAAGLGTVPGRIINLVIELLFNQMKENRRGDEPKPELKPELKPEQPVPTPAPEPEPAPAPAPETPDVPPGEPQKEPEPTPTPTPTPTAPVASYGTLTKYSGDESDLPTDGNLRNLGYVDGDRLYVIRQGGNNFWYVKAADDHTLPRPGSTEARYIQA